MQAQRLGTCSICSEISKPRMMTSHLTDKSMHLLAGAPGLGPLSQRRDIIVFKKGYRSRQYCLSECVQVCAAALNVKK